MDWKLLVQNYNELLTMSLLEILCSSCSSSFMVCDGSSSELLGLESCRASVLLRASKSSRCCLWCVSPKCLRKASIFRSLRVVEWHVTKFDWWHMSQSEWSFQIFSPRTWLDCLCHCQHLSKYDWLLQVFMLLFQWHLENFYLSLNSSYGTH